MTAIEAATFYVEMGFHPVPIPTREKAPVLDGWQTLRLTAGDLRRYFNGAPQNIGLLLGDEYGSTDVDLDCPEALAVAAEFLPETRMIFGRQSSQRSHHFYRMDPPAKSKRYVDPVNKEVIVELRCQKTDGATGLQTVVPPSIHPEGEQIRFEPGCDGYPANVDAPALQAAVARIAASALLARHWPAKKAGRNEAFMALAGALARAGWALDQAVSFHRAIYRALWGTQADFSAACAEVVATYEKHGANQRVKGVPSLVSLIDKRAVNKAREWLGITQPTGQSTRLAPAGREMNQVMSDSSVQTPDQVIDGVLPRRGLGLLGGRPKDGKTWLACQIALSIVSGQALGGWLRVNKREDEQLRVALWALEDQEALTKDKFGKLLTGAKLPDGTLNRIMLYAELPHTILDGGDDDIRAALREHPVDVIILDSLFKLSGASRPNADIGQRDYQTIDKLRKIALEFNCLVLIVMHTKKGAPGGNPIENLLGTTGIPAAADVIIELKRYKAHSGKLTVVGRSVQSDSYELAWHGGPDKWGWIIQDQGDESDGETGEEVLAYLDAQGDAKPGVIAAALKKSFGSVWQSLLRLQEKGKVTRMQDKRWSLRKS